ncbi:tRNA (guanosine(46)-N7)-methyltransferase TrmB [Zavarzinia sp. CC-PAN008]|uniref:tRNA (guanosine(46)-N7)-methyltransferase TrmB n=1 Tax=Zavarzinia sp. CC-PAN008 TaxID=3243332 RepID=UPI003F746268
MSDESTLAGAADEVPQRPSSRRVWGRQSGHKIRPERARVVADALPRLTVQLPPDGPLDPLSLFDGLGSAWLEIGFGGGEHLVAQAEANPGTGLIGCEPFRNGVAKAVSEAEARGLANVRVWSDDARLLVQRLATASLARAFILFPDPWPKARHHKRRIVEPVLLRDLARALAPGAELRLATDHADYAEWMLAALPQVADVLSVVAVERSRPAAWPATRYEAKALAKGLAPHYITARRQDA